MLASFLYINVFITLKNATPGIKDQIQLALAISLILFGMFMVSWSISGAYLNPAQGIT
jgi:glycerol uptake facilitator-like aquaporin